MFIKDKVKKQRLPLYEVTELSMEEALLVLAAEKELLKEPAPKICPPVRVNWQLATAGGTARVSPLAVGMEQRPEV